MAPQQITNHENNNNKSQPTRVLERSGAVVQIVDARDPLFYLSKDLRKYAVEELKKPMIVIVNKSDFLTTAQRSVWSEQLLSEGVEHFFYSAFAEQEILDEKIVSQTTEDATTTPPPPPRATKVSSSDPRGVKSLLNRLQLQSALLSFASANNVLPDSRYDDRYQFGFVGFPNVGKSSVINSLVGSSKHAHGFVRVAVAAKPGMTKHFQTILLPDNDSIMVCDCPGLVFPSFVRSTADMIAAGVFPIAQMRDFWPVVKLICERIPREILNSHYGIRIPVPSGFDAVQVNEGEPPPPPTAKELLTLLESRRHRFAKKFFLCIRGGGD